MAFQEIILSLFSFTVIVSAISITYLPVPGRPLADFKGPPALPLYGSTVFSRCGDLTETVRRGRWVGKYGRVIRYMLGSKPSLLITGAQEARGILNRAEADGRPYLPICAHDSGAFDWLFAFMSRENLQKKKYIDAGRRVTAAIQRHCLTSFGRNSSAAMIEWLLQQNFGKAADLDTLLGGAVRINAIEVGYGWKAASIEAAMKQRELTALIRVTRRILNSLDVEHESVLSLSLWRWMQPVKHWRKHREQICLREEWKQAADALVAATTEAEKASHGEVHEESCAIKEIRLLSAKGIVSREQGLMMAATITTAALGTSEAVMRTLIYAVAFYEGHQSRLQAILDEKFSDCDHLPTLDEEIRFPELIMFIWEVMRLHPLMQVLFWKAASSDFIWREKRIEKGTILIPIASLINRDPEFYGADADEFRPDRFLDTLGTDGKGLNHQGAKLTTTTAHAVFGVGRRICPGAELAEHGLTVVLARLLYCFEIKFSDPDMLRQRRCLDDVIHQDHESLLQHPSVAGGVYFSPRKPLERLRTQLEESRKLVGVVDGTG